MQRRKRISEAHHTGSGAAKQKRDGSTALGTEREDQKGMVNIPGMVCVTLTRVYSGRGKAYDDDNLSGGLKSLRDAVAETLLGRKGDSQEDGLEFSYHQEKGEETKTIIEIYRKEG